MVKHRKHEKDFYAFSKGHVVPVEGEDMSDEINSRLEDGYDVTLLGDTTIKKSLIATTAGQGIDGNGYSLIMATEAGAFDNATFGDRESVSTANGKKYAVGISVDGVDRFWLRNITVKPDAWIDDRYLKAINFRDSDNCLVENCEFTLFSRGSGVITFNDCDHLTIAKNYIHHCYTNSTTGTSQEAQCSGIEGDGDRTVGSLAPLIVDNTIEYLTASYAHITAFGAMQTDAINLQGNKTTPTRRFVIARNKIRVIGDGIDLFCDDGLVTHNEIEYNWNRAIKLIHGASRNTISHNVIRNSGFGGIVLSGSANASVGNVEYNIVEHNHIYNVGIVAVWTGADGQTIYDPAGHGGVGAHAGMTTHGIDLNDSTNAVTYPVKDNLVRNNFIDLNSTGNVGIRAGLYTAPSATNYGLDNRILNYATEEYQDPFGGFAVWRGFSAFTTLAAYNVANTFTQPQTITVNSASSALRVTQTGSGNALLVEDDTATDSTAFAITSTGSMILGGTLAETKAHVRVDSAGALGPTLFIHNRASGVGTKSRIASVNSVNDLADGRYASIEFENIGATNGNDVVIYANASGSAPVEILRHNSAKVTASKPVRVPSYTVATLPSAATMGAGSVAFVTDATATTFASTVAGGGANNVPVYSDGTNWKIG